MEFYNHILHFVWIGDLIESELFDLGGGLDLDISVFEEGRNDPDDFRSDILDFGELELRNLAVEKPLLVYVYDPFVGDDPSVEIIIDPEDEKKVPNEECSQAFGKDEEIIVFRFGKIVGCQVEKEENENQAENGYQDGEKMQEKNEPMAAQEEDHLFVIMLSGKIYFTNHRDFL